MLLLDPEKNTTLCSPRTQRRAHTAPILCMLHLNARFAIQRVPSTNRPRLESVQQNLGELETLEDRDQIGILGLYSKNRCLLILKARLVMWFQMPQNPITSVCVLPPSLQTLVSSQQFLFLCLTDDLLCLIGFEAVPHVLEEVKKNINKTRVVLLDLNSGMVVVGSLRLHLYISVNLSGHALKSYHVPQNYSIHICTSIK